MSCKDHTPGPWHWEDNGMWGNTLFNDKKKSVAYIYNPGSFSFYINISPPDECLIAAAPDLLEELKYLVKTIKEDETTAMWLGSAKLAIAKATWRKK